LFYTAKFNHTVQGTLVNDDTMNFTIQDHPVSNTTKENATESLETALDGFQNHRFHFHSHGLFCSNYAPSLHHLPYAFTVFLPHKNITTNSVGQLRT
jgi:hypothetical protein